MEFEIKLGTQPCAQCVRFSEEDVVRVLDAHGYDPPWLDSWQHGYTMASEWMCRDRLRAVDVNAERTFTRILHDVLMTSMLSNPRDSKKVQR